MLSMASRNETHMTSGAMPMARHTHRYGAVFAGADSLRPVLSVLKGFVADRRGSSFRCHALSLEVSASSQVSECI